MSKIVENQQQEASENGQYEPKADSGLSYSMRRRLDDIVDLSLANVPLLACCFITGLLDTTMFQAYGTFVSMQTGNTIFLALGASNQNIKPYDWARSLVSIGCFAIGAVFFSRLHKHLAPRPTQRGVLALGFFIQAACVCASAALAEAGAVNQRQVEGEHTDWREIAPIALLSFQAAGQIVASRVLGVNEIPTVVITSLMCDLMSDPRLLARPVFTGNRKRNNRVGGFVLTLVGSIIGGWMLKATRQVQPVLWLVFAIKFVISIGWVVWKGQDPKGEDV
ncbi:hypothetical protein INS49_005842 [Diaporthe citri]|uniref:uncharacterized protein n=1 Tax=Diaporthe citri TaxID=83186 RepID=UPI001C807F50|nr:uncharacterized protein INS49_005842 [Diaporthe citri]KAG6364243.1 hypothetical protein INS49_005842 [Diaporthe citri]